MKKSSEAEDGMVKPAADVARFFPDPGVAKGPRKRSTGLRVEGDGAQVTAASPSGAAIRTFADVEAHIQDHGPAYLSQALRTLRSHHHTDSLRTLKADLGWFLATFPKSTRANPMPRPDLGQTVAAYKKWHADIRRALSVATGARAARAARSVQTDGWSALIAAVALHTGEDGIVHPLSASTLPGLADLGRRQGFQPWELTGPGIVDTIEAGLAHPGERKSIRQALRFLEAHRDIPEIGDLLPPSGHPFVVMPTLREAARLPDSVEEVIQKLVTAATVSIDTTNGKTRLRVSEATKEGYLAAMRHHMRTLMKCPADPALNYTPPTDPVTGDLSRVNDVIGLFGANHVKAAIRWSEDNDHLPNTPEARTVHAYYQDIVRILTCSKVCPEGVEDVLKGSHYMQDARAAGEGMTAETKAWCEALLTDPKKEPTFHSLHKILMAKAEALLEAARQRGRSHKDQGFQPLTPSELIKVRALGTVAAAAAIEITGRPVRLGNVLGFRLRGQTRNFHQPTKARPAYGFELSSDETKAGKAQPRTDIQKDLGGSSVLDWYLSTIRPLFPHADTNIHLFPSVQTPEAPLDPRTFDIWFQQATSQTDLPMTFHRFRHGTATMLLDEDWNNLALAADMLGNTAAVCERNYAWINKRKLYDAGQRVKLDGQCPEPRPREPRRPDLLREPHDRPLGHPAAAQGVPAP